MNSSFSLPENFEKRILSSSLKNAASLLDTIKNSQSPTSIRINKNKKATVFLDEPKVDWCLEGRYLEKRPLFTADPLFHAGAYYVQEASSMFLSFAIKSLGFSSAVAALDLCAAPGGKSTLIIDNLPDNSFLLANEIVANRAKILLENILKWGSANTIVTCSDSQKLGQVKGVFDLIVVDAPCSGEGLFRKQPESVNQWSEEAVVNCAIRQNEILENIWPALKPGGFLIYSTCTYNSSENINLVHQFLQNKEASSFQLNPPTNWQIEPKIKDETIGYQFYPHKIKGEGFFLSVINKAGELKLGSTENKKRKAQTNFNASNFVDGKLDFTLTESGGHLCVLEAKWEETFFQILKQAKPFYTGFPVAEIKGKLLNPSAFLPFFTHKNLEGFKVIDLALTEALQFLKGETFTLSEPINGWFYPTFEGLPIGLAKGIGNRFNNYFPKNWRIRLTINQLLIND